MTKQARFERFVGIDWSGAKGETQPGIKVAEFKEDEVPRLVCPDEGANWSRRKVLEYIATLDDQPTLIGIDFAFSVPWPTADGPLPVARKGLESVGDLWGLVEDICDDQHDDLFAGSIWLLDSSPFRPLIYHYQTNHKGHLYQRDRFRATEQAASQRPISVYHMAGAQVGAGSFAGMRMLHALARREKRQDIAIWPFEQIDNKRHVIVEVYPSLFYRQAGSRRPRKKDPDRAHFDKIAKTLAYFGISDGARVCGRSVDAADAVVTAVALAFFARKGQSFIVPHVHAINVEREGWIFGLGIENAGTNS